MARISYHGAFLWKSFKGVAWNEPCCFDIVFGEQFQQSTDSNSASELACPSFSALGFGNDARRAYLSIYHSSNPLHHMILASRQQHRYQQKCSIVLLGLVSKCQLNKSYSERTFFSHCRFASRALT